MPIRDAPRTGVDPRLAHHAAVVTQSGCVLAHVRAASPGLPVTETNCHPFIHGRFAFMHNGQLGGFAQVRREILAQLSDQACAVIEGSTDSEVLRYLRAEPTALEVVRGIGTHRRVTVECVYARGR